MKRVIVIAILSLAAAAASGAAVDRTDAVLHEDFEGDWPPEGWTVLSFGDTHSWQPTTDLAHDGVTSAWIRYGEAGTMQDEWLVSPAVDLRGLNQAAFEFYEEGSYWDAWGGHHYIMVSTTSQTDVGSFVVALDMRPGVHELGGFDGPPIRADLSAFTNESEVYIAFRYTGSFADHWFVDDCRVIETFGHDVAVASVSPDAMSFDPGEMVIPTVRLENVGLSFENDVAMRLDLYRSGALVRSDTITALVIPLGQSVGRGFPSFTVDPGHWYRMTATAMLPGDGHAANDVLSAEVDGYTRPRTPLGIVATNNNHLASAQAELALNAVMASQDDAVALIRAHTAYPTPDAVHLAAPTVNALLAAGVGTDSIPRLRLDGIVDAGVVGAQYGEFIEARKSAGSPMDMTLAWDPALQQAIVTVDIIEPVPSDALLRLRVAVTEDGIDDLGTNGVRYHDQSLRSIFPDSSGAGLPAVIGLNRFALPCPLDPTWDVDRLRCTAWVSDDRNGAVLQAVTDRLGDMGTTVATDVTPRAPTLDAVTPNPFNPSARISFTTSRTGPVRVAVYDLGGRRVRLLADGPLPAGRHGLDWHGRDDHGRSVSSGTYLARVVTTDGAASRSMVLVR